MNKLYPLKFTPVLKDKIWGGQRMKTLGFDFGEMPNCGEAWLISGIEGNESIVAEGWLKGNTLSELMEVYMEDLVGDAPYEHFGEHFPLLVKILDADDWLSIQVHPDDEMAQREGFPNGKTEMWYVLEADEKAEIISGFARTTGRDEFLDHLNSQRLDALLKRTRVAKGDVFFTPAGRVHALGPGIMLAEIQQSSDLTYRVYDFDRPGLDGLPRELHLDKALEAIDYSGVVEVKTPYQPQPNRSCSLVDTPYFTVNHLGFDKPVDKDLSRLDSFVVYLCVSGSMLVETEEKQSLSAGEAILIPAVLNHIRLIPQNHATLLEVYIR
jgi:mannose-6-phosphate isomerase